MLNRNGSTLIESLLAFEIFVVVIVAVVSLYTSIHKSQLKLADHYVNIEENIRLEHQDFISIVETVLH